MFLSRNALITFLLAAPALTQAATSATFSYDPTLRNGPQYWGQLAVDGNACDGQKNSPIAVTTSECTRWGNYEFTPGTCATNDMAYSLTNTGVKASFPDPSVCTYPTVKIPGIEGEYQALQFHVHTSSEHTIDGGFYGAELHIVHQQIGGDRYAVVGMMIDPTSELENDIFEQLLAGWESEMSRADSSCALERGGFRKLLGGANDEMESRRLQAFNPYDLLPKGVTFYHYDGGLTTPPCSEVVWWNLADNPVAISPSQYQRLVDYTLNFIDPATCEKGTNAGPAGSTSRPVQPLNGRFVDRICPAGFGNGVEENLKCPPKKPSTVAAASEESPVEDSVSGAFGVGGSSLVLATVSAAMALML